MGQFHVKNNFNDIITPTFPLKLDSNESIQFSMKMVAKVLISFNLATTFMLSRIAFKKQYFPFSRDELITKGK